MLTDTTLTSQVLRLNCSLWPVDSHSSHFACDIALVSAIDMDDGTVLSAVSSEQSALCILRPRRIQLLITMHATVRARERAASIETSVHDGGAMRSSMSPTS